MRISTLINVIRSKLAKITYPYCRAKVRRNPDTKVKLVAIAKNESAYLPEWVFHHLYFGFDHISIYYNGCSDNTKDVAQSLTNEHVTFVKADDVFEKSKGNPQVDIYRFEFSKSRREGFDHVMFLDLDEFWVPTELNVTIHEYIKSLPYFDSLCFQWVNRVDEAVPFGAALNETLKVEAARQVKAIHKSFIVPGLMTPHNLIDNSLNRIMEDGRPFVPGNKHQSLVATASIPNKAFILHRKYRSKIEYIALLGRGRPLSKGNVNSSFKDNRNGYCDLENGIDITFNQQNFRQYADFMTSKLLPVLNSQRHRLAKEHVMKRYSDVVSAIQNAPKDELPVLTKILRNVDIEEVQHAFEAFKRRHAK